MSNLISNGLTPHADFPSEPYDAVHAKVVARWSTEPNYHQYAGAWNALTLLCHLNFGPFRVRVFRRRHPWLDEELRHEGIEVH